MAEYRLFTELSSDDADMMAQVFSDTGSRVEVFAETDGSFTVKARLPDHPTQPEHAPPPASGPADPGPAPPPVPGPADPGPTPPPVPGSADPGPAPHPVPGAADPGPAPPPVPGPAPKPQPQTLSAKGAKLVQSFESCARALGGGKFQAYLDPVRVLTIGWGHTNHLGRQFGPGAIWTQQECDVAFASDMQAFENAVHRLVKVPLNQGQFDALVSFCYNVGEGNLAASTLLKKVNARDFAGAAGEFGKWVKAKGVILKGLVRRRAAEAAMFQSAAAAIGPVPGEETSQEVDEPEAPHIAGLVPDDWMPDCEMKRIICHWTAGSYKASDHDRECYHILIEKDGNLIRGELSIKDNVSTADDAYAHHTKGCNTKSIGISVCCMANAIEAPFNPGLCPMTKGQWDLLAQVAAQLAKRYGIPVTSKTILGHGEVQKELGIQQNQKWDPMVLPWEPMVPKDEVGARFRARVSQLLATAV